MLIYMVTWGWWSIFKYSSISLWGKRRGRHPDENSSVGESNYKTGNVRKEIPNGLQQMPQTRVETSLRRKACYTRTTELPESLSPILKISDHTTAERWRGRRCVIGELEFTIATVTEKTEEKRSSALESDERGSSAWEARRRPCSTIFHVSPTETFRAAFMSGRDLDAFRTLKTHIEACHSSASKKTSRQSDQLQREQRQSARWHWASVAHWCIQVYLGQLTNEVLSLMRSLFLILVCAQVPGNVHSLCEWPHWCPLQTDIFTRHISLFTGWICRELVICHACDSPTSLWSDGPALQSIHLQLIKSTSLCRPNGRLIHQGSARLLHPRVPMSGPLSALPTYIQFAMTTCGHPCSSGCPQVARHGPLWLKQLILIWKLLIQLIHLQPRWHFLSFSQI